MKTTIKLQRKIYTETTTLGELFLNDKKFCYTLEDVVRPDGVKIIGETAIPDGLYKLAITYSPRFRRDMIELLDVPSFRNIRIHGGNTHKDTEGCILVAYNLIDTKTIQGSAEKGVFAFVKQELSLGYDVYMKILA